jgi:micrococcal nuclease
MEARMMRYRVVLLAVMVAVLSTSLAEAVPRSWTGKVVAVTDGDTIKVMRKGKAQKVRLFGVDCPESKQDFGTRAKWFTSGLCYGQEVRVEPMAKDRYKRYVAWVILPDGRKLNEELVRSDPAQF